MAPVNDTPRRALVGDVILATVLVAAALMVGLWGPAEITRWVGGGVAPPHAPRHLDTYPYLTEVRQYLEGIRAPEVEAVLAEFSSQRSRMPGYAGHERSARYIRSEFERLGLEAIAVDTFQVSVPMDKGAVLTVEGTGETIELHGLWPNHVRTPTTPPGGVVGPLIDGGTGGLADFNGSVVEGSVVLMGFGCGMSYLRARVLGAEAILLYDDGQVTREQALDKFLKVPVNVRRYWIAREDAQRLLERRATEEFSVRVQGRMDWESVPAYNVYGYLPGLDEPLPGGGGASWLDQTIVVSAYYDAVSVVPALAPGAESACGITALLQLARVLGDHPPHYPVLFLATSGHFEGMEGVNDFLCRHARKSAYFRERMADPIDFRLFIGLDLSSQNRQVGSFSQGVFYTGWKTNSYVRNLTAPYARRFQRYVETAFPGEGAAPRYVDAVAPSKQTWKDFMPVGLALEAEAPVFVGLNALSLATPDDVRRRVDTPVDLLEHVDVEALTRQIQAIGAIFVGATRDPELFPETALRLKDQGHSLSGSVYWFNREVNFAVPKDPIDGAVVTYQQTGSNSIAGVRTLMVARTNSAGRFRYNILRNILANRVLAYKTDESGDIIWAPDLGTEGAAAFPVVQKYVWWEDEMVEVLFPCRSLDLFDIVDVRQLVALDAPTILGENDSPLQWYGEDHVVGQSKVEGKVALAAVVYARPDTRVKILMSTGLLGIKYLLTNAPEDLLVRPIAANEATPELLDEARGVGYLVDGGMIRQPLMRSTADMWVIDDVRMKVLERYGVRNERMVRLHELAREYLDEARAALESLEYDRAAAALAKAAGYENRAYPDVKATANDTVNGIIFYFILLIPFSFFAERLLFGFSDIRSQVGGFAAVFLLVFIILHQVHPAFKLSSSPYIILLAFIILAMGSIVIGLILSKFKAEMHKSRRQGGEVYEADVGRLSATMAAVLLGISNLRKRKIRTALTATTLILLSFTTLSFTSISTSIEFYRLPRGDEAPYLGGLVRERNWKGMQPMALESVRNTFGSQARVVPRSWFLLPEGKARSHIHFTASTTGQASYAYGVVGLSAEEPAVTGIDQHLLAGRWFGPGEREVCILPHDLAGLVGIHVEDVGHARIRLLGQEYRVVGLIDAEGFNRMKDLDGEKLTPVDLVTESSAQATSAAADEVVPTAPIRSFIHLEASNILLLPHDDVLDLGGQLRSVAVSGYEGTDFITQVEGFVTRVAFPMFAGTPDGVSVYSSIGVSSLSGLSSLLIPLLIAALIILNTMTGSVYERVREIGIYSSLGLTPVHVGALFLAEAGVFATVGAVMGYLLGQTLALGLSSSGMLEGLTLNYSSLSAITSTLIVMVTVFLSTAYPAKMAADMTVPDVTRKWSFGDPEGDDWSFDFPFTVAGAEVVGLYAYLTRIFESYGEGSIGEFLTQDVSLTATTVAGEAHYRIDMQAWLAPYDLGIAQEVTMEAMPTGEHDIYRIAMLIRRRSGDTVSWKRINRGFLNVLRKRFLVWRTIPGEERQRYTRDGAARVTPRQVVAKEGVG